MIHQNQVLVCCSMQLRPSCQTIEVVLRHPVHSSSLCSAPAMTSSLIHRMTDWQQQSWMDPEACAACHCRPKPAALRRCAGCHCVAPVGCDGKQPPPILGCQQCLLHSYPIFGLRNEKEVMLLNQEWNSSMGSGAFERSSGAHVESPALLQVQTRRFDTRRVEGLESQKKRETPARFRVS